MIHSGYPASSQITKFSRCKALRKTGMSHCSFIPLTCMKHELSARRCARRERHSGTDLGTDGQGVCRAAVPRCVLTARFWVRSLPDRLLRGPCEPSIPVELALGQHQRSAVREGCRCQCPQWRLLCLVHTYGLVHLFNMYCAHIVC